MVKIPSRPIRRVCCVSRVRYLGPDNYLILCWDQAGDRYFEAEVTCDDYERASNIVRARVNKSYHAKG